METWTLKEEQAAAMEGGIVSVVRRRTGGRVSWEVYQGALLKGQYRTRKVAVWVAQDLADCLQRPGEKRQIVGVKNPNKL